ncbi:hypothetical protein LIA77_07202 [Sarocladium implicatum]|nr:hypothetical protein LIA77_07202 [Sarocladium implicatum]
MNHRSCRPSLEQHSARLQRLNHPNPVFEPLAGISRAWGHIVVSQEPRSSGGCHSSWPPHLAVLHNEQWIPGHGRLHAALALQVAGQTMSMALHTRPLSDALLKLVQLIFQPLEGPARSGSSAACGDWIEQSPRRVRRWDKAAQACQATCESTRPFTSISQASNASRMTWGEVLI